MLKALAARLQQGHRTMSYPARLPDLPERYAGRPRVDSSRCESGCEACVRSCPTGAISAGPEASPGVRLDLGRCLFCLECVRACPQGAVAFPSTAPPGEPPAHAMAVRARAELEVTDHAYALARELDAKARHLFGHSLKLREVSAGGCNGCEVEVNVLNTVVFDLGRFGIQMVASPRHADGLLITGPVTTNMREALLKTYAAVPAPKIVVAVGACAISGGPYEGHREICNGADSVLPVDLYVPGCPPHPLTILDGLLRLLGRLQGS